MAIATETVFGSHVLTIDRYTKTTAALAAGETIQSDRFRVGGHSWYIKCCPRWKDEEGVEWVSVFLWLDLNDHGGSNEDNVGGLLLASEVGRDVTFVVGGEHFTAHSCVLATRTSTAFMAEVLAGKENAGSRHVRIDGIGASVFGALLDFIYTGSLPDVEDEDAAVNAVRGLLAAADRYDMERLKMVCFDVLCSHIHATTALSLLDLSKRHGCCKLNQACVEYVSNMLNYNMEKTNRWLQPGRN